MKNECLFCGIVHGDIPSYTLFEDELFLVILDRFPKCVGHTLIIPKKHAGTLLDLPDETAAALMPLAKRTAKSLYDALGFEGLNLVQNNGEAAGQQINHFHLHLIPRRDKDAMLLQWQTIDPSPEEFESLMEKVKGTL